MIARIGAWLRSISFAWSCLQVQLCAYQEMRYSVPTPIYLSDDATEDELAEMAAEQRAAQREIRAAAATAAIDALL